MFRIFKKKASTYCWCLLKHEEDFFVKKITTVYVLNGAYSYFLRIDVHVPVLEISSVYGRIYKGKQCNALCSVQFSQHNYNFWIILLDGGNKQNKYHFAGCKMRIYEQLLKIP